jgi:hypothetical protein
MGPSIKQNLITLFNPKQIAEFSLYDAAGVLGGLGKRGRLQTGQQDEILPHKCKVQIIAVNQETRI